MPLRRSAHLVLAAYFAAWLSTGCAASAAVRPQRGAPQEASGTARVVPLAEYLAQLPAAPITVGLDVDDTTLFSTPAFLHAWGRLVPEPPSVTLPADAREEAWRTWVETLDARRDELFQKLVRSSGSGLTPYERAQWVRFWDDVNTSGDVHSPPKVLVRDLVRNHVSRGDRVVFITARPKATLERLSEKLRFDFGAGVTVEFSGNEPKDELIRRHGVIIYYGDADGDMQDAVKAGVRGVRILRSRYSSNTGPVSPGAKGEWFVIAGSEL